MKGGVATMAASAMAYRGGINIIKRHRHQQHQ